MIQYYIVYPRGDKTRLSIISLDSSMSYELDDYRVASRESFFELEDAIEYAKSLALKHSLTLDSSESDIRKELDYLD